MPMSWQYILTACIRVSTSFSFLANSLMSSMYISEWSFPAIYLVCIWLCISRVCGWVASSLLQIAIVIAHLPARHLSGYSLQLSFSLLLSIPLSIFSCLLWLRLISWQFIIQLYGTISYAFLLSMHTIARFFRLILHSLRLRWSM